MHIVIKNDIFPLSPGLQVIYMRTKVSKWVHKRVCRVKGEMKVKYVGVVGRAVQQVIRQDKSPAVAVQPVVNTTSSLAVSDLTTDMELCCWIAFRVKLFLPIADVGNLPAGCGRQWAVGVHARPGQACYLSVSGNWASLATAATCTGLVGSHRLPSRASSRPTCPVGTSLVECFVYFCYKWWN